MVLPIAFIIGVIIGIFKAKNRNGNKLDLFHYGAIYGIALVLLTLLLTIIFQRSGFLV